MRNIAYPKGRFWETDANGFLLNDASLEKIAAVHRPAIEMTVAAYRSHLGADLHSIYLRGSVPRGLAIPGLSDLDCLALATGYEADTPLSWAASEEAKIVAGSPRLAGVQFEVYALDEAVQRERVSELCFVLKTQAVCVSGEDVAARLPNYRADHTVANIDIVRIEPDIDEALGQIRCDPGGASTRYWCQRIAKNLIRACFALIMVEYRRFTRDLGLCAEGFLAHYPEQRRNIEKALHFVQCPTEASDELVAFLADFGSWVVARANDWLDAHNPERYLEMRLSYDPRR